MSPLHPGTGEVTGWWSADLCVLAVGAPGWEDQLDYSVSNVYDEFSCKLSQNPYFSVTHLLFSQNPRLGFWRITVFHCPGNWIKPCVSDSVFSTAARRLAEANFEYTVVLFIYISKYLTSQLSVHGLVHWKHRQGTKAWEEATWFSGLSYQKGHQPM